MYSDLSVALADPWAMFYHAQWPADRLHPVCDLKRCLEEVNHGLDQLGRDIRSWPTGPQDQAARLLWVNWIYNRLPQEPIRKPILAHADHGRFTVDCGDTRLMALSLYEQSPCVSVIVMDHALNQDQYAAWARICTNQDLLRAAGFAADAHVIFSLAESGRIDWLEIGDISTAHHMHDVDQRIRMISHYVMVQERDFVFDKQWARTSIDWTAYD